MGLDMSTVGVLLTLIVSVVVYVVERLRREKRDLEGQLDKIRQDLASDHIGKKQYEHHPASAKHILGLRVAVETQTEKLIDQFEKVVIDMLRLDHAADLDSVTESAATEIRSSDGNVVKSGTGSTVTNTALEEVAEAYMHLGFARLSSRIDQMVQQMKMKQAMAASGLTPERIEETRRQVQMMKRLGLLPPTSDDGENDD